MTFEIKTVADWMGHLLYLPRCSRCGIALERSDRVSRDGGTGFWCMSCGDRARALASSNRLQDRNHPSQRRFDR